MWDLELFRTVVRWMFQTSTIVLCSVVNIPTHPLLRNTIFKLWFLLLTLGNTHQFVSIKLVLPMYLYTFDYILMEMYTRIYIGSSPIGGGFAGPSATATDPMDYSRSSRLHPSSTSFSIKFTFRINGFSIVDLVIPCIIYMYAYSTLVNPNTLKFPKSISQSLQYAAKFTARQMVSNF